MKYMNELVARYPVLSECIDDIIQLVTSIVDAYYAGNKLLICGNGGSAADSEHIVGELMKGFHLKRPLSPDEKKLFHEKFGDDGIYISENLQMAIPAISLTGHPCFSTAFQNDCDYQLVFAQQVYGYGKKGDLFLGITTSGNSRNVILAAMTAKLRGLKTAVLTGKEGGKIAGFSDICIKTPSSVTHEIQELHLPIYHAVCLQAEFEIFNKIV